MKKFKDFLSENNFHKPLSFPSVSVSYQGHTLELRFDSKDVVVNASYQGSVNPWLASLCFLIEGKSVHELETFSWKAWDEAFKDDQLYWDLRQEEEGKFIQKPFELLKAGLDVFKGRDYLYEPASPLVCRCFGIRESDILEHLQKEAEPTLETLAGVSKAGMGCRSCVPQLKRWFATSESKKHFFKDRPVADWLLQIDESLAGFPQAATWKMEVKSFKGKQVLISYDKDVSQREEEEMGKELQLFLGEAVDSDLAFFLSCKRHFSNAKG
jgi:bacterioferritin-associated ferredoxin